MIEFLAPERLLLLLVLPPLGWFLFWAERVRRKRYAALNLPRPSGKLRIVLPLLIVAALIGAISRPYTGYHDIPIEAEARDVMVVVDVSMSMLASDAAPSRLEVAKRKIFDLIELATTSATPLRIGIVTFSGSAFRYCPLTSDLEIVRTFAESLSPELMTAQGSSLAEAVTTALETLAKVGSNNGALLILSDGEDQQFRVSSVASAITESGTPIYTLGIGTEQGGPIPLRGGRFFSDLRGNIVITRLTEQPLTELAAAGGGLYQRATLSDADLKAILSSLPKAESTGTESLHIRAYHEFGPWLVVGALLLVLATLVTSTPHLLFSLLLPAVVIAPLLLGLSPQRCLADTATSSDPPLSLEESYQAYQRGDYDAALSGLEGQYQRDPLNKSVAEGLARSLYRLKRFEESERIFDQLAAQAESGRDLFTSTYNGANAALMRQDFDAAISKYERALTVKPGDVAATSNLDLAKRLRAQSSQPRESSSSSTSSQSKQRNESNQPSSQSSTKHGQSSSTESSNSSSQSSSSTSSDPSSLSQSSSDVSASSSESSLGESSSSIGGADRQNERSSSSSSLQQSSSVTPSNGGSKPTPTPRLTPDPFKALNDLEDKPLLPKQPRNQDNPPSTGQTW